MQPTSLKDLEAILQKLDSKKAEWANLSTLKRADILRRTLKCVIEVQTDPMEWSASCPRSATRLDMLCKACRLPEELVMW